MQQFYGLQYLRFFCAMLIVLMHATEAISLRVSGSQMHIWNQGSAGVHLFFVISGFVMALTTPNAAKLGNSVGQAITFMKRRLIRIVPLYWLYTTVKVALVILVPAMALRSTIEPGHLLASYFFWPQMSPWGLIQPILPVGWSLNFEMLFYFIFAAAIALRAKRILFCLVIFAVIQLLAINYPDSVALSFYGRSIIFEFLFGAMVAWLVKKDLKLPGWLVLALYGVGLYSFFFYPWHVDVDDLISKSIPSTLVVLAVVASERFFERATPDLKRLAFWGDASYSIYLSHSFVVPGAVVLAVKMGVSSEVSILLFTLLLSAIAGGASYRWIERPMTGFFKAKLAPPPISIIKPGT